MIVIISGKLICFSNICESDDESSYKSLLTVCSANEFTCSDGDDDDDNDDDGNDDDDNDDDGNDDDGNDDDGDDDSDDDGDDGAPSMH